MKNYLNLVLPVALAGALCTGCSQDSSLSPTSPSATAGTISFAPHTVYARTGDITTSNLNSFQVYAYTGTGADQQLFMDNVTVSRTANNTWTYSPLKYWPAEAVDFYAYAPTGTWAGTQGPFNNTTAYENYPGDTDLVYAVSLGNKGNATGENAQVVLNFRHALAKVALNLSSSDDNIEVKVSNVVMAGVYCHGVFGYPSASTTASASPDPNSVCTWSDLDTPLTYLFHMSQTNDDRITLTTTPDNLSAYGLGGDKYMLPQPLPYGASGHKVYLGVMCAIYDKATGVQLWPNDNTPATNVVNGATYKDGILEFPLSTSQFSSWEPGHYYIYNVIVNANPDMGTINFGMPTVDTYVTVETTYE